ncbi:hypothetical protein ALC53_05377 [Atta colombica]|uniref:Uncharacterized protein n=1 Tax=Atta colombica TaxID=520822 RepID=A0A195BIX0_9HYME|nr:hypothetical protein ALC53_05377 [Atta colombica]
MGLIGYDCGGEGFNITTLSLLNIGECNMENMHSHVSIVHNGRRESLQEIGKQDCKRLHKANTIRITNNGYGTWDNTCCVHECTIAQASNIDVCEYRLAQDSRSKVTIENLDIFLYVNSKFIYVEKYVKTQLTQLYRDMEQKCALERQILKNALTLANIASDEIAYQITRKPGYIAVTGDNPLGKMQ